MTSIKIILILIAGLTAIIASIALPRLAYRLVAILLFLSAAILIISPDAANTIAHILGVGRGADLLLYLSVFAGIHAFLLLYARTRRIERKLVEHVRVVAISRAVRLS